MNELEAEIKKLGYEIRLLNEGEVTCVVTIPKWDIEETTTIWEDDENNYHIATADQPGWDEFSRRRIGHLKKLSKTFINLWRKNYENKEESNERVCG